MTKNRYGLGEWSGAFGDLGTFIPLVVGYISIMRLDPLGILVMFGVFLIATGLYFKTPLPVQPMKAIAGVAIVQTAVISPNILWGAGIFTGLFWLVIGLSGALKHIGKIVKKPVILGLVLGLGINFIIQGITFMREDVLISVIALILTFALMFNKKIPALLILLLFGIIAALVQNPQLGQELRLITPGFRLPSFALGSLTIAEVGSGILILALAQIPLTLGNAVFAVTSQNNQTFPDRPITEKKVALSQGIMNVVSPIFGGIPMCHGAGGMASHVRFGAKTGGATIILGGVLLILGLFFSNSVLLMFSMIPASILGVILLFAGLELAMTSRGIGGDKRDFYVLILTAAFSIWNIGIGFLVGLIAQELVKRKWLKP
jgi:MFS superfamily sulfate permease-like transporter